MPAYYNENDPFAAAWLRNLIKAGLIANGDVDDRSIRDVRPDDLRGYSQCHFFAGIGGWSLAFRLAGLSDDFPAWSGSCPCQPFSVAGKKQGTGDARHLWPEWFRLICECRPSIVFGEQVASAISHGWLDLVASDLEGKGYAVGAAVLPACVVGAPHRRDRLWFVADASGTELRKQSRRCGRSHWKGASLSRKYGEAQSMADADFDPRRAWRTSNADESERRRNVDRGGICENALADPVRSGLSFSGQISPGENGRDARRAIAERCRWPVESSVGRVAHGVSNRVGKLRGLGNAIVPQAAAEFIAAALEAAP